MLDYILLFCNYTISSYITLSVNETMGVTDWMTSCRMKSHDDHSRSNKPGSEHVERDLKVLHSFQGKWAAIYGCRPVHMSNIRSDWHDIDYKVNRRYTSPQNSQE